MIAAVLLFLVTALSSLLPSPAVVLDEGASVTAEPSASVLLESEPVVLAAPSCEVTLGCAMVVGMLVDIFNPSDVELEELLVVVVDVVVVVVGVEVVEVVVVMAVVEEMVVVVAVTEVAVAVTVATRSHTKCLSFPSATIPQPQSTSFHLRL